MGDFNRVIITSRNGRAITLGDVAHKATARPTTRIWR